MDFLSRTARKGQPKGWKKPPKKTKFQEYLDMEKNGPSDDLETERKLAKKLKVKCGKLSGFDDGMNDLFDGIPSVFDSGASDQETEEGLLDKKKSKKKNKRKRSTKNNAKEEDNAEVVRNDTGSPSEVINEPTNATSNEEKHEKATESSGNARYVAPHLRARNSKESEELVHYRRRVRGLLNKLSESNVESITEEIASIFRSVARSDGFWMIGEELLLSFSNGPRSNEQHAAVFAAFAAGMSCMVGIDFGAKVLASLATAYEDEYLKEDSLSLRNITLLLCYLCVFGVCHSGLIYDFLSVLSKRLMELDVSIMLSVLQCCGMKLRGDDPISMKGFILDIQNRVSEMKSGPRSSEEAQAIVNNKRMDFMLETICDIKNNKFRAKGDPAQHTRVKKWLQKLKANDIMLRGLKWNTLLDPNKKGQWWFPGEITSTEENAEGVAVKLDNDILERPKLMQLAASLGMNTDVRRAIFFIIMTAEDYVDAFEKLLRLDISGKQDREIMRVLVKCCLHEKVYNKYYAVLASKLCSHEKNQKFTLQYCLWDQFKELDSMEPRSSVNLASFVAEMLCSFTLSISLLKVVDLSDPKKFTAKRIMHFRMLFIIIFEKDDAVVWNVFSRVTTAPEHEMLSQSLEFFMKRHVLTSQSGKAFTEKFKLAKKALNNVSGVLM